MPAPEARALERARAMHRLRAARFVLTCSLLCCACGGGNQEPLPAPPVPTKGIPRQRPATNTATLPPAAAPEANRFAANPAWQPEPQRPRFEAPPEAPPQQNESGEEGPKARDYNAELTDMLTKAVPGCLTSYTPTARTPLSVSVTAHVMASGTMSSAQASGSGLTPAILACIQKLATTLRLRSPVDGAPRSIQVQLNLQPPAEPVVAKEIKPEEPKDEEDQRDENPRDSKLQHVENDPKEVTPKDDPVPEEAAHPDGRDEAPKDEDTKEVE